MMRPVYYLEFDDPTGTERDRFATFRLHHAWAKRLRKGRLVLLLNTKTRQVYGKAKVLEVHAGKVKGLLDDWAWLSHLAPPAPPATTLEALADWWARCAKRRYEDQLRRYGPNRYSHDTNMTVIILKRIV